MHDLPPPALAVVFVAAPLAAAFLVNRLLAWLASRACTRAGQRSWLCELWPALEPLAYLLALLLPLEQIAMRAGLHALLWHAWTLALIASLTVLALRALGALEVLVRRRHPATAADNLADRRVLTQMRVLIVSGRILIVLLGLSIALTTFPIVRALGASLLASAGIAGIVVGFAARPLLSNLLAGLQLALAQPLRLDDVVIVEGQWGRIEEIASTYVVVRIWDDRRLIVPLTWFIETPFQNWTHTSAQLTGTVYLWVDFHTPLAPLRAELQRLCHANGDWDGRFCGLQVTDSNERAMQVRALVTAGDSSRAWNLRCAVREGLVAFLQREFPHSLPRLRAELSSLDATPIHDATDAEHPA